jgi:hypothetical protein
MALRTANIISVVSCVNNFEKYDRFVRNSFKAEQRDGTIELITVDNVSNRYSAPAALNRGLERAGGEIIIFCHQDVAFPEKWTEALLGQIAIVEQFQKEWGVLGTFGVAKNGMSAGHVIDYCGHFNCGPLPVKVQSLDEHCLIIRKGSGLRFDEQLGGFHLYGADICLEAMARGLANFAIDACVKHESPGGVVDDNFDAVMQMLFRKWKSLNPPIPVIETTCRSCRLKGGITGLIADKIERYKKKQRRMRIKELINSGVDIRTLRHDSI